MTRFESKYFRKFIFTKEQIRQHLENSLKDLKIAKEDSHAEVRFTYSYTALIKAGIALIAACGNVKVRSMAGHHIKIIEKTAEILEDDSVVTIGNAMRMKRNEDFYGGGVFVSEKESREYLKYVEGIIKKIKTAINKSLALKFEA